MVKQKQVNTNDYKPYQKVDRSKWALQDYINEGINITREAQEGDALYREQDIVMDVYDWFSIWRIVIKDFLFKEGYLKESHHFYSNVEPLLEADSVPLLKGGFDYGIPQSGKSQTLLKNIREETNKKLGILRSVKKYESGINIPIEISYNISIGQFIFNKKYKVVVEGKQKDTADILVDVGKDKKVSWDEIYEKFKDLTDGHDLPNTTELDIHKRSVRTAVTEINNHTKKYLDEDKKLIDAKNNEYWLQYNVDKR